MKEGYVTRDQEKVHFITATVVDWIDVFSRQNYRDSVIECMDYCIKNKGMIIYAYVIMSNHIHMVVHSNDGKLSDLLRDFKKFTAITILDKIQNESESRREWMLERFQKATETHTRNKNYQFWQYGNHAEEVYSEKFLWSKIDYIHMNPVRSGLVKNIEDYIYSSASNYINKEGLVEVELAEIPKVDVLKESSFIKYLSQ
ncbi:transposase [Flavobacterium sp.]|uniref:REP-associated tyrosine transposase n=1 Tax=Flavobacterium sp. TaxID=239 RepID=UPI00261AB86D|nr:transposase [Flavobacterium sp.]MDG2432521.1 transposase [Flavobacterium sp.]